MPSTASTAEKNTPLWMHASVSPPDHTLRRGQLDPGKFGGLPSEPLEPRLQTLRDHTPDEDTFGRDAVECGGGPEIDGDRVPSVHLLGRKCVHDTVGADRERLIDIQPNRQRAPRVHYDGCLSHNLLERIRENSGRRGHDRTQNHHGQVVVRNSPVVQQ